ncbi:putative secreted protein with PEP-CTERM sorting signal [Pseudoduganella flava]|nr:putative secreted protein with PEP-CTERM sorting signal [Pseudoduganella flava]
MFPRHCCAWLLLVLVTAVTATAAQAANGGESFSAGFSNVRVQVFDLTPDDGQPAAYQLGTTITEMRADIASSSGLPTQGIQHTVSDNLPYTLQLNAYGLETTVYTGAGLSDAGFTYVMPSRPVEASAFRLEMLQVTPVILAPHSLLVVDGMANRTTSDLHPYDFIYLRLNGELAGLSTTDFWICCEAPPGTLARPFQFAYANTGSTPMTLSMMLNTMTEVTLAVPEPSGWAMLLAGLVLLAVAGGRGTKRALGRIGKAAGIVALCGNAGIAAAQSAADPFVIGRLSNVALTVVDIAPDDGITAAYHINEESVGLSNAVWWLQGEVRKDVTPPVGTPAQSQLDFMAWQTSIATNGARGDAVSSIVWDAETPLESSFYYSISNSYDYAANITLRPGTALVLSGTLFQQYVPRGMHPYDLVQSFFTAEMNNEYGASHFSSTPAKYGPDTIQEWNQTFDFTLAITNPDPIDAAIGLRLHLYSGMIPRLPLLPVPEPASYAMLLAGLGVLCRYRPKRAGATAG